MPSYVRTMFAIALVAAISACGYGPETVAVKVENARAKKGAYTFAVATDYKIVSQPTGAINTFPNGGVPRVSAHEARIYVVNLEKQSIKLAAQISDWGEIPRPKQVSIEGWIGNTLYFTLFGYGADGRSGDDLEDPREVVYRINPWGLVERVDAYPNGLQAQKNSGPTGSGPFLRLSKGHTDVDVGINGNPGKSVRTIRFSLEPHTGEAKLSLVRYSKAD